MDYRNYKVKTDGIDLMTDHFSISKSEIESAKAKVNEIFGHEVKKVVIENGVTSIGDDAFRYCRSLTSIKFRGTKEEWNNENPILRLNEIGIESDTRQFKIGDGKTPWVGLQYYYPKKISSTDGSTVSLSSNRIEITNSDGSH